MIERLLSYFFGKVYIVRETKTGLTGTELEPGGRCFRIAVHIRGDLEEVGKPVGVIRAHPKTLFKKLRAWDRKEHGDTSKHIYVIPVFTVDGAMSGTVKLDVEKLNELMGFDREET
jgi:hypothetical protein